MDHMGHMARLRKDTAMHQVKKNMINALRYYFQFLILILQQLKARTCNTHRPISRSRITNPPRTRSRPTVQSLSRFRQQSNNNLSGPDKRFLYEGPNTKHHTPYTLHPTPCTMHPAPCTLHHKPHTLHPTPYTIHYTPSTLHHWGGDSGRTRLAVQVDGGVRAQGPVQGCSEIRHRFYLTESVYKVNSRTDPSTYSLHQ